MPVRHAVRSHVEMTLRPPLLLVMKLGHSGECSWVAGVPTPSECSWVAGAPTLSYLVRPGRCCSMLSCKPLTSTRQHQQLLCTPRRYTSRFLQAVCLQGLSYNALLGQASMHALVKHAATCGALLVIFCCCICLLSSVAPAACNCFSCLQERDSLCCTRARIHPGFRIQTQRSGAVQHLHGPV